PRDGAWLPAPVLIARVLRLAVTQLENWAHALVGLAGEESWIGRRRLCRWPPLSPCRGRRGDRPRCSLTANWKYDSPHDRQTARRVPHQRDELYFVTAGTGRYRVEEKVTAVGPGDLLFTPHMWRTVSRISRRTFCLGAVLQK